jgi:periplasmic copper chaperone A
MRRIATVAVTSTAATLALFVLAVSASAHVTISAPGATSGGSDQEITFRVPVEKNADTVGLKVQLPTDTPIASVDVEPLAGWTHTQTTVTLAKPIVTDDGNITQAVSEIDWTAASGQGLKPGEFGAFTIIAGQLPDASSLTFKAIQLYSDGSQVDWTQTEAPGSTADLDNPAQVLTLAPAASGSGGASSAPASTGPNSSASGSSGKTSNTGPLVIGIVALVVALAALGLAVVGRARGQRPS